MEYPEIFGDSYLLQNNMGRISTETEAMRRLHWSEYPPIPEIANLSQIPRRQDNTEKELLLDFTSEGANE